MKDIKKTINYIFEKVLKHDFEHLGYINGKSSKLVFLSHYYHFIEKDKTLLKVIKTEREAILNHIRNSELVNLTMSYGLTGIIFSLEYSYYILKEESDIDIDRDFYNYLLDVALEQISQDNYDLLTGGVGILNYLINNKSEFLSSQDITTILNILHVKSIDGIWLNEIDLKNETCNLGLAHGYVSIIAFLLKLYERSNDKRTKQLITEALDKTVTFKNENSTKCIFPNHANIYIKNKDSNFSRLSWCYGDLSLCMIFLKAGEIIDKKYHREGLQIIEMIKERTLLKENLIVDASFCHGTAGIAHIINKFVIEHGMLQLKELHQYWISETIKMFESNELKSFEPANNGSEYIENYGILNGYCGIGLVLIDYMANNQELIWSKCLLV